MTEENELKYPFPTGSTEPCDDGACDPSPSAPNPSDMCGGGSLVNTSGACEPCDWSADGSGEVKFLGCSVLGFNGKLGYNGSESSVTIELAAPADPNSECAENCWNPAVSCSPPPSPNAGVYEGAIGNVYTFSLGTFCFRGILTDHQYTYSDSGYRYRVTLSDGRKVLEGVAVILNDLYTRVPDELYPNVINALYDIESSVGDNTCASSVYCKDFGKSGKGDKGMYLVKALEAVSGKTCSVPVSKACLGIDLRRIIKITSLSTRVSSSESNVLELITLACEEAGYDFYVEIVGYDIVAYPVNNKSKTATNYDSSAPLFQFISNLSDNYVVLDREYGQEMTFNKSKKLVFGDNIKYMTVIEPSASPCYINDPGSMYAKLPIDGDFTIWPSCDPLPSRPAE